jgi:signal transduction histidine kinase
MEVDSINVLQKKPVNNYPLKPIDMKINTFQSNAPMAIMEEKLENKSTSSINKLAHSTPLQVLQDCTGIFAPALVHELRNPLTNIKLAAEILKSGSLNEEQRMFADTILRGVIRINNLVTDYLISYKKDEIISVSSSDKDSPY